MTTTTAQIERRANHPTLKSGDSIVISKGAKWSQGVQNVDEVKDGPLPAIAGSVSAAPGSPVYVDSDGDILVHFSPDKPSTYCGAEYVTADTGDVSTTDYAIDTAVCTTDGGKVLRISLTADRRSIRVKDQLSEAEPLLVDLGYQMPALLDPLFRFTEKDSSIDIFDRVEAIRVAVAALPARETVVNSLNTARAQHEADIAVISEALNAEAEGRGWCDEYEAFVDGINDTLNVKMTLREKEWKVRGRIRVQTWVDVETTLLYTGRPDDDAAEDALRDAIDEYEVKTAVEYDFDVEEVEDVRINEA
jgi:hypothetical protein